jgi:hypothetical protein
MGSPRLIQDQPGILFVLHSVSAFDNRSSMSDDKTNAPRPEVPPENIEQLPATSETLPATSPDQAAPAAEAVPVTAAELPLGDISQTPTIPPAAGASVSPDDKGQDQDAPTKKRTLDEYRALDWSKNNGQLARELNVSRQRIQQVRQKLFKGDGASTTTPSFDDLESPTSVAAVVNYDLMAATVFDMSTGTLVVVFGEEWKPQKPEERDAVCGALKNYFQAKQMQDLPPGLMLTAVLMAYAAPRLRAPSTSSKLKMGWHWLKTKVAAFRNRNKAKKP